MFARHLRFFVALVAGLVVGVLLPVDPLLRVIVAVDLSCAIYIALMAAFAYRITPDGLRAHAGDVDEGIWFIALLALAVVIASLGAVFLTLNGTRTASLPELLLAIGGIPLGWAMLQTVATFHYARIFYGPRGRGGEDGGLRFEGCDRPGVWEFLYYAFTIGMTAQTSDTSVTSTAMRRATLAHAILSFFYNTVILALAINAVVSAGG